MNTETSDAIVLFIVVGFLLLFSTHQAAQLSKADWPENIKRISDTLREKNNQNLEEIL